MNEFNRTNWAKTEFSRNYLDKADIYIVERRRMFAILRSFFGCLPNVQERKRILDLGCGDGILTYELLETGRLLSATLVDGSEDMLEKAGERLKGTGRVNFIKASFQEIIRGEAEISGNCDLVASSMAIHHLTTDEKKALFRRIYSWLGDGGYFVNIDVALAPAARLDYWYMQLWREWMDEKKASLGIPGEGSSDIIERYKDNADNKPDTLDDQLNALKEIGFRDVDCFYKYGIFTVYGGGK